MSLPKLWLSLFVTAVLAAPANAQIESWADLPVDAIQGPLNAKLQPLMSDSEGTGTELFPYIETSEGVQITKNAEEPYFVIKAKKKPTADLLPPGERKTDQEINALLAAFVQSILSEHPGFLLSLSDDLRGRLVQVQADQTEKFSPAIISVQTEAVNQPPRIDNPGQQLTSIGVSAAGTDVSLQITATDGDGDPLSYSADGLPDGLSISNSGLISGQATATGSYNVTVTVSDGYPGGVATIVFIWVISEPVLPPPSGYDPFEVPEGLSMPVDSLLACLGYNSDHRMDGVPFPFTVEMCVRLAEGCYKRGLYMDARAIAEHGLKTQRIPALFYIRGASELALGDSVSALRSIKDLLPIHPRSASTQSLANISGPISVRFIIALRAVREEPEMAATNLFMTAR